MTLEEYKEDILLQLGFPVIDVEINDQLEQIIDMAFRELKHFITDTRTATIPYAEKMHIEEGKFNKGKDMINTVVQILRSNTPNRIADFQDIMYLASRQSSLQYVSLTDYNRALLTQQLKNSIATDLDFYWDKPNSDLYCYANYPKPDKVTVIYIPEYKTVEDIVEPFWQNLLRRLALALTKQILGRVRGKFKLNSSTWELDSDQLLSEASTELEEIRGFLNENSDMMLPID